MSRSFFALLACLALGLSLAATAGANTTRASKGDAEAVLNAFGNGGLAIRAHSTQAEGAPADAQARQVSIRPFGPWDGAHFCADDWHTIVVADIEGGDTSFHQSDAAAIISDLAVQFFVDGVPQAITQTPVKRFDNPQAFGIDVAYYSQWGRTMSPTDLTVGAHSLRGVMTNAAGTVVYFDSTITFFVDASGTGACL